MYMETPQTISISNAWIILFSLYISPTSYKQQCILSNYANISPIHSPITTILLKMHERQAGGTAMFDCGSPLRSMWDTEWGSPWHDSLESDMLYTTLIPFTADPLEMHLRCAGLRKGLIEPDWNPSLGVASTALRIDNRALCNVVGAYASYKKGPSQNACDAKKRNGICKISNGIPIRVVVAFLFWRYGPFLSYGYNFKLDFVHTSCMNGK
jgi:hypothetical protein